uniref:WW domain binding protein VOPP1 n=1 Tax=Dicentrarchus labrax TaxID=13489 RepID=A0A8P4KRP5_DICLA
MRNPLADVALTFWLFLECVEAKKYCWYFEGGYPIYFICRSYEDCCGTRCCVRALSIQRLWYFWVLLMMGVLFCCGAGFFIRRRMYPSPLRDEPAFNVSFTRHPVTTPVSQQPGSMQGFGVNGMTGGDPGLTMTHPAQFQLLSEIKEPLCDKWKAETAKLQIQEEESTTLTGYEAPRANYSEHAEA